MEITKIKNQSSSYNFYFKEENKELGIIFGGNLDLYWTLIKKEKIALKPSEIFKYNSKEVKETFIITKDNYFIYSLFEELYNNIKECNIFNKDNYLGDEI